MIDLYPADHLLVDCVEKCISLILYKMLVSLLRALSFLS